MEKLKEILEQALAQFKERMGALSRREKIIMVITAVTVIFYITYTVVFQSTLGEIVRQRSTLIDLTEKHKKLMAIRGKLKQLGETLESLRVELKQKEEEEIRFKESLQARNQINKVLQTLETTAKDIPMQLRELTASTSIISKKADYALEKKTTEAASPKQDQGTVKVNYTHNKIRLKSRSDYVSAVTYIKQMMSLPYAISIISLTMQTDAFKEEEAPGEKAAKGKKEEEEIFLMRGENMVNSIIDMEIYFR